MTERYYVEFAGDFKEFGSLEEAWAAFKEAFLSKPESLWGKSMKLLSLKQRQIESKDIAKFMRWGGFGPSINWWDVIAEASFREDGEIRSFYQKTSENE